MTKNQRNLRARINAQPNRKRYQAGQILIIVVFAITGLVMFVGLVVDTGLLFIGNGKLRRAVDAAALAAASQYRKDPNPYGLSGDAVNFLKANGIEDPDAIVRVCNSGYPALNDNTLCTTPAKRRLVRVEASAKVKLAFLPVLGINNIPIHASATSEAASLDIVLAMDVSESMTFNAPDGDLMLDPGECNNVPSTTDLTNCQPFHDIQAAAQSFVEDLFPTDGSNQYDRVAVIPFDRNAHYGVNDTGTYNHALHLGDSAGISALTYRLNIINTIRGLRVFNATGISAAGNPYSEGSCLDSSGNLTFPGGNVPCRYYPFNGGGDCFDNTGKPNSLSDPDPLKQEATFDDKLCLTPTPPGSPHIGPYIRPSTGAHYERTYIQMICPGDSAARYALCGTTNTGGAFNAAGLEFVRSPGFRQESLWIVIMLTDGVANHSNDNLYCPVSAGSDCQDSEVKTVSSGTRHCQPEGDTLYSSNGFMYSTCVLATAAGGGGGVVDVGAYDADDYARDEADFVALGQSALIYTIGFGDKLKHGDPNSSGEQLLNYAADIGDDGKIDTAAGALNSDYFFAHDATALGTIFKTISDRIATRLTH